MKRLIVLFMLILLLLPVVLVQAQEALEPGTILNGEITDATFEIEYTFTGVADSVIVVEMNAVDTFGELDSPILILLDSSGSVVVDTTNNFDYGRAILVTQLPADDTYTLLATRQDGRAGTSLGEYTLELIVPSLIASGEKATGSVSSEGRPEYYVINADSDFVLNYTKNAGDFNPEIAVGVLNEYNSGLDDYATATGKLENIAMGDIDAGLYVVEVKEALFDFNFDVVTADFNLSVDSVE